MIIECLSPLHCGGGDESWLQDQPVVRDAFGYWFIPGTSIAGAMRELAEQLDDVTAKSLFGGETASLFWASDARLLDYDGRPVLDRLLAGEEAALPQGPFIRDHVRLESESETTEEGGKFDEEIVPAGTRFALELAFDPWDRSDVERELALFDQICALAAQRAVSLGGSGTNGMGAYRALRAECRDFDLTSFVGNAGLAEAFLLRALLRKGRGGACGLAPCIGCRQGKGLQRYDQNSVRGRRPHYCRRRIFPQLR